MVYIGDIYLPTAVDLDSKDVERKSQAVSGIGVSKPHLVEGKRTGFRNFKMRGYLFTESGSVMTADDYAEALAALEDRDSGFNFIDYVDTKGYITDVSVRIPNSAEKANLREYTINGKFLPFKDYESVLDLTARAYADGHNIDFPIIAPLPVGATDVRIKTPVDELELSAWATIVGYDGSIPLYKPFPLLNFANKYSVVGTTVDVFDEDAYGMDNIQLDTTSDAISWKVDVGSGSGGKNVYPIAPKGRYRLALRAYASGSATATVTVSGSVSGTLLNAEAISITTGFTMIATSEFNATANETLTITITSTDTDDIFINYVYFDPKMSCSLAYTATEYDKGQVKVYDTVTNGNTTVSTWKRVFDVNHEFDGDMVIQNSISQWTINPTVTWANTGKLVDLLSSTQDGLNTYAFSGDYPDVEILSITPYCVELKSVLTVGNSESVSVGDKEIEIIKITPIQFIFEMTKIGDFRYDWFVAVQVSTSNESYAPNSAFKVESESSSVGLTPVNGMCANLQTNRIVFFMKHGTGTVYQYPYGRYLTAGYGATSNNPSSFSLFTIPLTYGSYLFNTPSQLTKTADVERKFFKDDFLEDSSVQYTLSGTPVFSSGYVTFDADAEKLYRLLPSTAIAGIWEAIASFETAYVATTQIIALHFSESTTDSYIQIRRLTGNAISLRLVINDVEVIAETSTGATLADSTKGTVSVAYDGTNYQMYWNGTAVGSATAGSVPAVPAIGASVYQLTAAKLYDLTFIPSISFSEAFGSDSEARYAQGVSTTGTSYTAAAAGDVAVSGGAMVLTSSDDKFLRARLKSYKFGSGNYKVKVTDNSATGTVKKSGILFLSQDFVNGYKFTVGMVTGTMTASIYKEVDGVATLLGSTTVAGAVAGDPMIVEVDVDAERGVIYGYAYLASGTKPTTAIKCFDSTFRHGYIELVAETDTAGSDNINTSFDDIVVRAELYTGKTNIPTTESNFLFKDSFINDSLSRYFFNSGDWTFDTDHIDANIASVGEFTTPGIKAGDGSYELVFTQSWTGTNPSAACQVYLTFGKSNNARDGAATGTHYWVRLNYTGSVYQIELRRYDNSVNTYLQAVTYAFTSGTKYKMKVVKSGSNIKVYIAEYSSAYGTASIDKTETETPLTGYFGFQAVNYSPTGYALQINGLSFTGTMYYYKRMYRGVQIGAYHNRTTEVAATRYLDDFNWDTSGEMTMSSGGTKTFTLDGTLKHTSSSANYSGIVFNALYFDNGSFGFAFKNTNAVSEAKTIELAIFGDGTFHASSYINTGYSIVCNANDGSLKVRNNATWTDVQTNSSAFAADTKWHVLRVDVITSVSTRILYLYVDDVYINTYTISTAPTTFKTGMVSYAATATNMSMEVKDINFNGYEYYSIDGCSLIFGGLPHGARYDFEEYAAMLYTQSSSVMPLGRYLANFRTIATKASSSLVFEHQNTSDSTSLMLADTAVESVYTDIGTSWAYKVTGIELDSTDADDSLTFKLKRADTTDDDSQAILVSMLALFPISGINGGVALLHDLGFQGFTYPSVVKRIERRNELSSF